MSRQHTSSVWIIAFLYLGVATTTTCGRKQSEIFVKKEDGFGNKERECWKNSFGNLTIPPPIECSLAKPPSIELVFMLKVLIQSNVTETMPKKLSPHLTDENRKAIFKSISDAARSLKTTADNDNQKSNINTNSVKKKDDDDLELLSVLSAASNIAIKIGDGTAEAQKKDPQELQQMFEQQISDDMPADSVNKYLNMIAQLTVERRGKIGPPKSTILHVAKCIGPPDLYTEGHDPSVETLFFLAQKLQPGTKFSGIEFSKNINTAPFLDSSQTKKEGTLSAALLIDLLVAAMSKLDTVDISDDVDAINTCDQPAMKGKNREKVCANDLQTMFNYTMAMIGKDITPASASSTAPVGKLDYTISAIKKMPAIHSVGCAKMSCPLALYMCQTLPKTVSYSVSLTATSGGAKLETTVICHQDTANWNPNSWIFKSLKSKPGDCSVCHFLAADDLAWMPKTEEDVVA